MDDSNNLMSQWLCENYSKEVAILYLYIYTSNWKEQIKPI